MTNSRFRRPSLSAASLRSLRHTSSRQPDTATHEYMGIHDLLSPYDTEQFKKISVTIESPNNYYLGKEMEDLKSGDGKLLPQCVERFQVVKPTSDGSIPEESIFPLSHTKTCLTEGVVVFWLEHLKSVRNRRKKFTTGLSEFMFPSGEGGDNWFEFRSPVAGFPPLGELTVIGSKERSSGQRKKAVGEYCLSGCDDGTVKWLHHSKCENGNRIWKIRLFERRDGEVLHLRDELLRTEPIVYNNYVFNSNTYIGGNVNGAGTQIIGTVNYQKDRPKPSSVRPEGRAIIGLIDGVRMRP